MAAPLPPGTVDAQAMAAVKAALSRVLDMDPAPLRADTPLADIGSDSVAVIAFVDVLAEDADIELDSGGDDIDAALLVSRTVGDLVEITAAALERQGRGPAKIGPA